MPPAGVYGLMAGSAASGLFGSLSAASTAEKAGRAANAQAQLNADTLEAIGRIRADETRTSGRRLVARQRVAFAKSGVLPGTGSALDLILDTEIQNELDALHQKFGLDSQAFQERLAGVQAEITGDAQAQAFTAQGIQSILTGAAGAAQFTTQAGFASGGGRSVFIPSPGPLQNPNQGPLGSFGSGVVG